MRTIFGILLVFLICGVAGCAGNRSNWPSVVSVTYDDITITVKK